MAAKGTFSCALLRNATRRKISDGDRERRVGNDALSLAIAFVEDPRLTMRLTTCSAEADPFVVSNPGQALKICTELEHWREMQ
jgi:hypothetical protein